MDACTRHYDVTDDINMPPPSSEKGNVLLMNVVKIQFSGIENNIAESFGDNPHFPTSCRSKNTSYPGEWFEGDNTIAGLSIGQTIWAFDSLIGWFVVWFWTMNDKLFWKCIYRRVIDKCRAIILRLRRTLTYVDVKCHWTCTNFSNANFISRLWRAENPFKSFHCSRKFVSCHKEITAKSQPWITSKLN